VSGLFEEGTTEGGHPADKSDVIYTCLSLRPDVKEFPAGVMEVLLGSEKLQLRSENDAYYLMCAWLLQSEHISDQEERQVLFKSFCRQLRFHFMSQDFLGALVTACPYARASEFDFLLDIMRCSHTRRTLPQNLPDSQRKRVKMGKEDRSMGNLTCTFKNSFNLAALLPLKKDLEDLAPVYKYIGLAWGFPVAIQVKHEAEGTLGIYVYVGMPPRQGLRVEGGVESRTAFEFTLKAGKETNTLRT